MAKLSWKPGNMLYPVPAVMVSCKREGEKPNIITVAWAGTVNTNPPMVSISVRPERYSYEIIKETKEFVINLVTKELVYATDFCGVRSGRDVDKFAQMKLHEAPSKVVGAPGIWESPVNIECRVVSEQPLGSHTMFLAEVVNVNVDDRYMDENGRFDLNSSGLITYSHGEYFELGKKLGRFGYSVNKNAMPHEKTRSADTSKSTDASKSANASKSVNTSKNADKVKRANTSKSAIASKKANASRNANTLKDRREKGRFNEKK